MAQQPLSSTTQTYLDIHDITNDLVIMKNGTTSLVLSVDAMNFGLLAEEEQDSIIYAYAGLLNSLNYPIQVIIRSQTKDVTSYLQKLKDQEVKANSRQNELRIRRYREFVSNLIRERNVLDKKFYVVIPATPLELGLLPVQSVVPGQKEFDVATVERSVLLEKAKNILEPKRDHLIAQFARIGLYSYQLATQEIIQLFYISYNPEAAEGQQIADSNSYNTPLVKASFEGVPMTSQQPNDLSQQPAVEPQAQATTPAPIQPTPATPGADPQPALPNQAGETPMNVPPAVPTQAVPPAPQAETPAPTQTPTTTAPAANATGVPVETGTITAPENAAQTTPAPATQSAAAPTGMPTSSEPTAPTPQSTDELAAMQEEINKTAAQIDPNATVETPVASTQPAPAQQSDQQPENLPEI